jgi:orotate phosphoribosyltransferase-like protein
MLKKFKTFVNEQSVNKHHVIESKDYYKTYKNILFTGTYAECLTAIKVLTEDDESLQLEIIPTYENTDNIKEKFEIDNGILNISEPYDKIKKVKIGDRFVYILFGDVNYYQNKKSILAIKGNNYDVKVNDESYHNFLVETKKRFNSISKLKQSDIVTSIETTAQVNEHIMNILNKPYIVNGFKKTDSSFKMKDIKNYDRIKIVDIFTKEFDSKEGDTICVLDDFITTGTSFRNAFDKIPANINAVGVCLFKLTT